MADDPLAYSPDRKIDVTASPDNAVLLWDVSDTKNRPRPLGGPLTGHSNRVSSMAFADDADILTTGSDDGTAILWDTTDLNHPRRLGHPLAHPHAVNTVAFAPAGDILATGNDDGTAVLWDLTLLNDLQTNTVEHACSITGGGLDEAEWARYIPELRYRNTCQAQAGQLR